MKRIGGFEKLTFFICFALRKNPKSLEFQFVTYIHESHNSLELPFFQTTFMTFSITQFSYRSWVKFTPWQCYLLFPIMMILVTSFERNRRIKMWASENIKSICFSIKPISSHWNKANIIALSLEKIQMILAIIFFTIVLSNARFYNIIIMWIFAVQSHDYQFNFNDMIS